MRRFATALLTLGLAGSLGAGLTGCSQTVGGAGDPTVSPSPSIDLPHPPESRFSIPSDTRPPAPGGPVIVQTDHTYADCYVGQTKKFDITWQTQRADEVWIARTDDGGQPLADPKTAHDALGPLPASGKVTVTVPCGVVSVARYELAAYGPGGRVVTGFHVTYTVY